MFDLYLIVLLISFFFWRITGEKRTKLKKKLFIWTTKSGETQHNKHTKCTKWLFISNFNNVNDVSDSGWFLHHFWLQEFIQKQTYEPAEKFFDTVNTQSSCDDFLEENRDTFIVMSSFFTWFIIQILNLCHRWHRHIHNTRKYLKQSIFQK